MLLHRNRLASFLAALAMVLQAFWPLLAQARPRIAGVLVPVCAAEGPTHYLELPAGKSPLDERSASHGGHCKLCAFGGDRQLALPTVSPTFFLSPARAVHMPVAQFAAALRPTSDSPAKPRAPPAQI